MSFVANVLTVLVASPSDVAREREIATEEIHRWNAAHGRARQMVLSPVRWETHSSPQMGAHPQTVLNKQILEDADIVVGIFWTRIGTPTPDYPSGTVEEIDKHVASGKLAMVYFSNAPIPPGTIDQDQWKALQSFKTECHDKGLFHDFGTQEQFRHDFGHHLNIELNKPAYASIERPAVPASREPAEPALSDDERELLAAIRADAHGMVLHGRTFEGFFVQANGIDYGDGTPRGTAILQQSLRKLRELGYLTAVSDEMDEMTGDGYARADKEASRNAPPPVKPLVSPKAAELLMAGVGNKGSIMLRSTIGDVDRIFAGGQKFPESKDQRASAEWREALEELEEKKLIHARSKALYEVTAAGHRLAETLSSKSET